jgi:hypothetical protein
MEVEISENFSEKPKWDLRSSLKSQPDETLTYIVNHGNPEPAAMARAILAERKGNSGKPKRGRPRLQSDAGGEWAKHDRVEDTTRRTDVNDRYRDYALSALWDIENNRILKPDYSWLLGGDYKESWRNTILTELGRWQNRDDIRELADHLCQEKPKTQDAIKRLRQARLGKESKSGSAEGLYKAILEAIRKYAEDCPDTRLEQVKEALIYTSYHMGFSAELEKISENFSENTTT